VSTVGLYKKEGAILVQTPKAMLCFDEMIKHSKQVCRKYGKNDELTYTLKFAII